jgi:hypothetical protein
VRPVPTAHSSVSSTLLVLSPFPATCTPGCASAPPALPATRMGISVLVWAAPSIVKMVDASMIPCLGQRNRDGSAWDRLGSDRADRRGCWTFEPHGVRRQSRKAQSRQPTGSSPHSAKRRRATFSAGLFAFEFIASDSSLLMLVL